MITKLNDLFLGKYLNKNYYLNKLIIMIRYYDNCFIK